MVNIAFHIIQRVSSTMYRHIVKLYPTSKILSPTNDWIKIVLFVLFLLPVRFRKRC